MVFCTAHAIIRCHLNWNELTVGHSLCPASEAIQKPLAFSSAEKKLSEKCYFVGTVLLTSQNTLVNLVHVSTDIRCRQWETLSNKRGGQQNDISVQLEKSFIIVSGAMAPWQEKRLLLRKVAREAEKDTGVSSHTHPSRRIFWSPLKDWSYRKLCDMENGHGTHLLFIARPEEFSKRRTEPKTSSCPAI